MNCKEFLPWLSRVAEGEATPDEAMRTARHLSDCTACRIAIARERRLAEMLEQGLDDPVQVGEEFVQSVMANLPKEPPPVRGAGKKRKLLRAVKLACIAGVLGALPLAVAQGTGPISTAANWSLPSLESVPADGVVDTALGLGGLLVALAGAVVEWLPASSSPLAGLAGWFAVMVPAMMSALCAGVGLVALVTSRLVKSL